MLYLHSSSIFRTRQHLSLNMVWLTFAPLTHQHVVHLPIKTQHLLTILSNSISDNNNRSMKALKATKEWPMKDVVINHKWFKSLK